MYIKLVWQSSKGLTIIQKESTHFVCKKIFAKPAAGKLLTHKYIQKKHTSIENDRRMDEGFIRA